VTKIIVVTGTNTGVGKTVFSAILTRYLLELGLNVRALKPLASGDRSDAESLAIAQNHGLALDEINPWWFPQALAPAIAAKNMGRSVSLQDVASFIRQHQRSRPQPDWLIVEMAGGLLSPYCEDGDALDLIRRFRALPLVLADNRLGVLHQIECVWRLWSSSERKRARLMLKGGDGSSEVQTTNWDWVQGRYGADQVFQFPELSDPTQVRDGSIPLQPTLRDTCARLIASWQMDSEI
jgi:dethiobiotin synthetase